MFVARGFLRSFIFLSAVNIYSTVKILDSESPVLSKLPIHHQSPGKLNLEKTRKRRPDHSDGNETKVLRKIRKTNDMTTEKTESSEVEEGMGKDSTNCTLHLTGRAFSKLEPPLHKSTLRALRALGFRFTAPVQQAVIPLLLTHKDVVVEAATGSGKTIAFLVPAFELPLRAAAAAAAGGADSAEWSKDRVGAIIIAPTRELAAQIRSVAAVLAAHCGLSTGLLVGGGNETASLLALHGAAPGGGGGGGGGSNNSNTSGGGDGGGCSVLIATPGRLESALWPERRRGGASAAVEGADARGLELLVLDEADRLLEMGFEACLGRILARLPRQRRTGLFSATMCGGVAALIRAGLRNPRRVSVAAVAAKGAAATAAAAAAAATQRTPAELVSYYAQCEARDRLGRLVRFLRAQWPCKAMVFFLTCHTVLPPAPPRAAASRRARLLPPPRSSRQSWSPRASSGPGPVPARAGMTVTCRPQRGPDPWVARRLGARLSQQHDASVVEHPGSGPAAVARPAPPPLRPLSPSPDPISALRRRVPAPRRRCHG